MDLADAIQHNRPHRITGHQAAHIVDILCAIQTSFEEGHPVEIDSTFVQMEPMEWGV